MILKESVDFEGGFAVNKKADAIVIGAGIIGACTAYKLAKKGYKTLSIDKMAGAGASSTSNSCAIVRAHYSTRNGVAMAYEGFKRPANLKSAAGCV